MVYSIPATAAAAAAASLLLLPSALAAGLYTKSSPVVQVDGQSYDSLIAKSNHTSIVEFYAPWCGHCKNLQPAYEKAARNLAGLAKVAAVNCDDEHNKPFCGSMGVQGFPTLKIVKPGRVKDGKKGKPIVEDYQGARTAKGIVDAVVDKIPNHVKRLGDKDYEAWLEDGDGARAILFSDKGTTSALLRAIAVDFLGGISVAQIRDKEKEAVEVFNVDKFPTLVLLPGDGKDPVTYDGEFKKEPLVAFLSQAASPNPDPAPKKSKPKSSSSAKDKSKSSKASSSFSKASASQASDEAQTAQASQTQETLEDDSQPTESPDPNVVTEDAQKPIQVPSNDPPRIASIPEPLALQHRCLNTKAGTCVLLLTPPTASGQGESEEEEDAATLEAISTLSAVHHKYSQAQHKLFPFYHVPAANAHSASLRSKLNLGPDDAAHLVALNGKRAWLRHYPGSDSAMTRVGVEEWIDAIRMGDGEKTPLPDGLVVEKDSLAPEPEPEPSGVPSVDPERMRQIMREQMSEGMDFSMEEMDDDEYERVMAQAKAAPEHNEL